MKKIIVLGASPDPERYSYKAMKMLQEYQHQTFLVSPKYSQILEQKVFPDLDGIKEEIDGVTIYVNPQISQTYLQALLKLKPKVVIFNPGSENPALMQELNHQGIKTIEACTLVLLRTQQFLGLFP